MIHAFVNFTLQKYGNLIGWQYVAKFWTSKLYSVTLQKQKDNQLSHVNKWFVKALEQWFDNAEDNSEQCWRPTNTFVYLIYHFILLRKPFLKHIYEKSIDCWYRQFSNDSAAADGSLATECTQILPQILSVTHSAAAVGAAMAEKTVA